VLAVAYREVTGLSHPCEALTLTQDQLEAGATCLGLVLMVNRCVWCVWCGGGPQGEALCPMLGVMLLACNCPTRYAPLQSQLPVGTASGRVQEYFYQPASLQLDVPACFTLPAG
jgi:hypothetical protein